jgi:hypothetical protein
MPFCELIAITYVQVVDEEIYLLSIYDRESSLIMKHLIFY